MTADARDRSVVTLRGSVGVFVTLAGVTAALTALFLGMRSVMEIGGTCAQDGPFEIARPCPKGIPLLMIGSIWMGIVMAGLYLWQTHRHAAPSAAALLWPALFLSLGWNFFEYGVSPPGGGGLAWGWLVPGVLFAIMGGAPLALVGNAMLRSLGRAPPFWVIVQVAAVAAGIWAGVELVRVITT